MSSQSNPAISSANRTWTAETDLTTPSLCSDIEPDREEDASPDDRIPSTPPNGLGKSADREDDRREQDRRGETDMEVESTPVVCQPSPAATTPPASPPIRRLKDVFAKRPPTSPMPDVSPRKPRPPARASGRYRSPAKHRQGNGSGGEDLPSTSSHKAAATKEHSSRRQSGDHGSLSVRSSSRSSSRSTTRKPRRQTLDEELKEADGGRSWAENEVELDSGVLMGVGTRNQRKEFLAHGGAGGPSVVMGVGYVEGAGEEAEAYEEDEYPPRKKKSPKLPSRRKARR
jgi:hypothetical protein